MIAPLAVGMAINGLVGHVETGTAWEAGEFAPRRLPGKGGTRGMVIHEIGRHSPGCR